MQVLLVYLWHEILATIHLKVGTIIFHIYDRYNTMPKNPTPYSRREKSPQKLPMHLHVAHVNDASNSASNDIKYPALYQFFL